MAVEPGQFIGNYRVLQKLGTGGMGAVYLAEHPLIGKRVALKVIHKELAGNREVISRFFNEARAVNKIGNEHIVEIHDFGQSPEGDYFFIMEYLEGRTLAQVLTADRVFDVVRTMHVGAQIAGALGAAHAAGIIHRDLKPDNVMLTMRVGDPDFVKILDFGLAKMFMGDGATNLTAAGVVLGTPQYMSPEACESKRDIDHRTDIYALGVLLFQMLCGQVPFDGQSMGEILIKQVMHAPPSPRGINPHIPPAVEQIILRCLAKSPDARFPTMAAVQQALLDPDRYLATSPPVMPAAIPSASAQARTLFLDDPKQMPGGAPPGPSNLPLRAPPPSMIAGPGHDVAFAATSAMPAAPAPPGMDATTSQQIAAMRRVSAAPGMVAPAVPLNSTMVIGTPPGYKDRPPRKVWPFIVIAVVAMGGAGAGIAVATHSSDDSGSGSASASGSASGSAPGKGKGTGAGTGTAAKAAAPDAGAPVDAATAVATTSIDAAPPDAAPAPQAPKTATLTIDTSPTGADVLDGTGKSLGKTKLKLTVPADGKEMALVFKKTGMKDKTKKIVVTEDQSITIDLEPAPTNGGTPTNAGSGSSTHHGGHHGHGSGSGGSGSGLMPPDF
ncbi:MAG TPA: serine/threonine-protein kinase [Kofleriaceae bacterium]|nr:serine/threonine-protein kinase [Kofleriaceae bacterium]